MRLLNNGNWRERIRDVGILRRPMCRRRQWLKLGALRIQLARFDVDDNRNALRFRAVYRNMPVNAASVRLYDRRSLNHWSSLVLDDRNLPKASA